MNCKDKNWLKQCECDQCEEITTLRNQFNRLRRFVERHHQKGKTHSRWKGGLSRDRENYIIVRMPDYFDSNGNGYAYVHRLVFQEYYQCCMLPWGDVHHKDGNKDNNNPSNLQGITDWDHAKVTVQMKKKKA